MYFALNHEIYKVRHYYDWVTLFMWIKKHDYVSNCLVMDWDDYSLLNLITSQINKNSEMKGTPVIQFFSLENKAFYTKS